MLKSLMKHLRFLESEIAELDRHIEKLTRPFKQAVQFLDTIPGVDVCTAENLLAEMGPNMDQFPSGRQVASWAGMCPGNNESAGKRKSGKTTKGNRAMRRALTEAAWAASRTKDTYAASKYQSLVGRRGKKRALIAVGHHILLAAYHIMKKKVPYHELGPDFLLKKKGKHRTNHLVKQLEKLWHKVILEKED
jgi:transposase